MRISEWARRLGDHPGLSVVLGSLDSSSEWRSVAYEARPVLLAAAHQERPRRTLIVTANYERALQWQAKLALCGVSEAFIHQLHSGISALFEDASPEHVALSERLGALRALVEDEACVVIGTPQAALERTLPSEVLLGSFVSIEPGDSLDPKEMLKRLVNLGYEHQEPVRLPGQFSQRGGIVDVFASGHDLPIRIELFGDEVESIRHFDPNSQRSIGSVPSFEIVP